MPIGNVGQHLSIVNPEASPSKENKVKERSDTPISDAEALKNKNASLSKKQSNGTRLVQKNSIASINLKGTKFTNAIKKTEKRLLNLVDAETISIKNAEEIAEKCLNFGCQKNFSLKKLKEFNVFLKKSKGKGISDISEKLDELFKPLDVVNTQQKATEGITKSTPAKTVDAKLAFEKLSEYSWGKNGDAINAKIKSFLEKSNEKFDKKLFDNIQKTLNKKFGITDAEFYKAWAWSISRTQGGEKIGGDIQLKFNGNTTSLNLQFTPQNQLSGFPNDTTGIKHYSSAIQNRSLQKIGEKGDHAVNLWRQDVVVNGQNMQFLRHGCTRGGEEASKEILLNALMLQYGDAINEWQENDEPLPLQFTNVQLMTLGHLADRKMPMEQINMFKELAKNESIELTKKEGRTIKVTIGKPLLFDFGVNAQHFRKFEKVLADVEDKEAIKAQNLESFKQLFGENFPNIVKYFGKNYFNEGSLIKKKLDSLPDDDPKKQQIETLANQILEIYQSHPKGLQENPYALPTRVLALTNLLGFASSFNCKSGKDRTGVCAMELSNLCAQIMSGQKISNPMEPITDQEKNNLQAIYKEGSCARDLVKINTIFQDNLNIQEVLGFDSVGKRFGVDWTKSFEENVNSFQE